jgi:tRNA-modifying protein YgfZ
MIDATAMTDNNLTARGFPAQCRPERAVIAVSGPTALAFLQNLLTVDVGALFPGQAAYGALLSPQGKILHDVFVVVGTDTIYLDCDRGQSDELHKRLMFYRLREKLAITLRDDLEVGVSSGPLSGELCYPDPRLVDLGYRAISPLGGFDEGKGYEAFCLGLGVVPSAALNAGQFYPHEVNLDQLHGVSFSKGCYVGQEIVSRMEHRGTARNRMLPIRSSGDLLKPGDQIRSEATLIGDVVAVHGENGLGLIRLDRFAEAVAPLLSGSVRVHVQKPHWARYEVVIPENAR